MSAKYVLIGGAVVALAGAVYYFSKDDNKLSLDKKVHTKENLIQILDELQLEYCVSILFQSNLINNIKREGKFNEMRDSLVVRLESTLDEKDNKVCNAHKINKSFLSEWI